jgi:aldose 1-epimerase
VCGQSQIVLYNHYYSVLYAHFRFALLFGRIQHSRKLKYYKLSVFPYPRDKMVNNGITEDIFGYLPGNKDGERGEVVKRFTLVNGHGMKVQVINYGAAITSLIVPDGKGALRDVVLGFDDIDGYLGAYGKNPYFGATIGRVANRTARGKFSLNGKDYQLTVNNGENHLHGGINGFDKVLWDTYVDDEKVVFSYLSKDGEEGYPGIVLSNVTFRLTPQNVLDIKFRASTTKPTPICLTNHSYFNLGGHEKGNDNLKNHSVHLNAAKYTPLDAGLAATGEIKNVEGTLYDFQTPKDLRAQLDQFPSGPNGYDINFCINQDLALQPEVLNFVGRIINTETKLALDVHSNQPGVQFYTANFLPDTTKNETPLKGKGGAQYYKHGGFCMETQNYPNAINMPHFPTPVLRPGEIYVHDVCYKFSQIP